MRRAESRCRWLKLSSAMTPTLPPVLWCRRGAPASGCQTSRTPSTHDRLLRLTLPAPPRPIASSHCARSCAHSLILSARDFALRDASLHSHDIRSELVEAVPEGTVLETAGALALAVAFPCLSSRETATLPHCHTATLPLRCTWYLYSACPLARRSAPSSRLLRYVQTGLEPPYREIVTLPEPILLSCCTRHRVCTEPIHIHNAHHGW
jgi:hypothetical protein